MESSERGGTLFHYWIIHNPICKPEWHKALGELGQIGALAGPGAPAWRDYFLHTFIANIVRAAQMSDEATPSDLFEPLRNLASVDAPTIAVAWYIVSLLTETFPEFREASEVEASPFLDDASLEALTALVACAASLHLPEIISWDISRIENSGVETSLTTNDLTALTRSCRILRACPVPIWGVPAAFEEFLWGTNRDSELLGLVSRVLNFHSHREDLVELPGNSAAWKYRCLFLMARLHVVTVGPATKLLANYRMATVPTRRDLYNRFGVDALQRIARASAEADECLANLSAASLEIWLEEAKLKSAIRRVVLQKARESGRVRARILLRDLHFHRLIMPRDWYDELELELQSHDAVAEAGIGDASSLESIIGHFHHEMQHGVYSAWPGYPISAEHLEVVSPFIPTVSPGSATMYYSVNVPPSGVGEGGQTAASITRRDGPIDITDASELIELLDEHVAHLGVVLYAGDNALAQSLLLEIDAGCGEIEALLAADVRHVQLAEELGATLFVLSELLARLGQLPAALAWSMRSAAQYRREVQNTGDLGQELRATLNHAAEIAERLGRLDLSSELRVEAATIAAS